MGFHSFNKQLTNKPIHGIHTICTPYGPGDVDKGTIQRQKIFYDHHFKEAKSLHDQSTGHLADLWGEMF